VAVFPPLWSMFERIVPSSSEPQRGLKRYRDSALNLFNLLWSRSTSCKFKWTFPLRPDASSKGHSAAECVTFYRFPPWSRSRSNGWGELRRTVGSHQTIKAERQNYKIGDPTECL